MCVHSALTTFRRQGPGRGATAASRSVLAVLHRLDGFLRTPVPSLLQLGAGPGVRWVSCLRRRGLRRGFGKRGSPPNATPFEGFPSSAAVPRHRGRYPPAVRRLHACPCGRTCGFAPHRCHHRWVDECRVGLDRDRGVAQHRTESSANRVARGISSPGPRIDPPSLTDRRTARTNAAGLPPLARRRVLALGSSARDRSRTPGRGTSAPSRRCDLPALTAPRSPDQGSAGSGRGSMRMSLVRPPVSRRMTFDDRLFGRPLRGELDVSIAPAIGSVCPPIAAAGHTRCTAPADFRVLLHRRVRCAISRCRAMTLVPSMGF
jgi:hypothetical protein